jgi:hypothetical protein
VLEKGQRSCCAADKLIFHLPLFVHQVDAEVPIKVNYFLCKITPLVGSLKINTALEYSTRVVQEGDRRCKKSTLNDLAYLTPLRISLMNPVLFYSTEAQTP